MKKQCRRRVWGLVNPIKHVMEGIEVTPAHLLDRLRVAELSAIEAFAKGMGTRSEWDVLTAMLNLSEVMARGGVGHEVLEACQRAQDGLAEARDRFERTQRMGLSGPAIQAMRDLFEYHDLQRTSITRGEYEKWIVKTRDRVRSAHPSLKQTEVVR